MNCLSVIFRSHLGILCFLIASATTLQAGSVSSVSRFGVTWTFDREVEAGRFANGDWWVKGPVTVTKITPESVEGMHGSMLNPPINRDLAFDSRMKRNAYNAEANVALQLPLRIDKPASLLSAISLEEKATRDNPQLETIAILTVLMESPPEGSFRPPYQGDDKTIPGNVNDLDYGVLRSLEPVTGAPTDWDALAAKFERPWIELKLNWTGRYTHPERNQPAYGRELAHRLGYGLLALQLDVPNEAKKPLFIHLVQIGIDIYGAARLGGNWGADGGHNQGRKLPLLLAAKALGDATMLEYADAQKHMIFQEDQQTFYVQQHHVDAPRREIRGRRLDPYTQDMIGMPEWGIRNFKQPERSGSNWSAYYRQVSGAPTITHVLAARLMGFEEAWNHPPLFDYYDRFYRMQTDPETAIGSGVNQIQPFTRAMWEAYRDKTPQLP